MQRIQLNKREQTVAAYAARVDSSDWKFKTLRGLSVESDRQREAIQTLLTYWDELKYRSGSWPKIDERKLNTMLFSNAYPDGATVTVLVLMDWDANKAVDALSFVSDSKTEQHSGSERFQDGEQYQFELITHPPNDYMSVCKRTKWMLGTSGLFEQQTADRTK